MIIIDYLPINSTTTSANIIAMESNTFIFRFLATWVHKTYMPIHNVFCIQPHTLYSRSIQRNPSIKFYEHMKLKIAKNAK